MSTTAIRLDIVFSRCISDDDAIDDINRHLFAIFGTSAMLDWRDDHTVEITTSEVDMGISTPRPWILREMNEEQ